MTTPTNPMPNHTIDPERLATLPPLAKGAHDTPAAGLCLLEAVAYVRGLPHSDHPPCVSPVIAAFGRSWNDALPTDEDRDRLLKPLIPVLVGTATTLEDEETRAWMVTDWIARVHAPAWLRLAGLTKEAEAIEACARIVDAVTARAAQPALDRAREASAAARDAAWDAARDALAPTVAALQSSAVELITAMCAVGRDVTHA